MQPLKIDNRPKQTISLPTINLSSNVAKNATASATASSSSTSASSQKEKPSKPASIKVDPKPSASSATPADSPAPLPSPSQNFSKSDLKKSRSITQDNMTNFVQQMHKMDSAKKQFGESNTLKKILVICKICETSDKYILGIFLSKGGWDILSKWFKDWFDRWSKNYEACKQQFMSHGKLDLEDLPPKHEVPSMVYGLKLLQACDVLPLRFGGFIFLGPTCLRRFLEAQIPNFFLRQR